MKADMAQEQTKIVPAFIEPEESRTRWLKSLEARDNGRFFRSGLEKHDKAVGAFLRGALYLVAARPGVGKTSYLISLAYRQAMAGVKCFFVSLEMPVESLWHRLACLHDPDLTLRELTEGELTDDRVRFLESLSCQLLNFSPRFFENPDFHAFAKAVNQDIEIKSRAILFVDYIGLFTMKNLGPQERYYLVSEVAKQLKLLARALDIPVISAVQLNRHLENRADKTPTLADLRDSGELENHADAVFALTRQDRDFLDVDVLKNRWGPLSSYRLSFDGPRAAVEEQPRI